MQGLIRIKTFLSVSASVKSAGVAKKSEDDQIHLKAQNIDTSISEDKAEAGLMRTAPEEPDYYIVQFKGAVSEEWKDKIKGAQGKVLNYIPNNAFIVKMNKGTLNKVLSLPEVKWVGSYKPTYKISPQLSEKISSATGTITITVKTFQNENVESIVSQAKLLGGEVLASSSGELGGIIRIRINPSAVSSLSLIFGIEWVEEYIPPKLMNDIATGSTVMNISNVWTAGLTGTGQTVAIADTGLDVGIIGSIHSDLAGRIITTYALGRASDWSDQNGHGTHVAGSVLGNGANSANQYRGPAYTSNLIFQSVMDATGGLGGLPADLNNLFSTPYTGGARIHTNSWGAAVNGAYDTSAQQADQFAWNNKDMLILFAAGNEGVDNNSDGVIDLDSLSSPGTAKNVLTVGASENYRPTITYTYGYFFGYPASPISTDSMANNVNGMAAFSSRGPTDDGRIKPDIVAPGTFIASTRSQKWAFDDNLETSTVKWSTLGSWARTTSSAHGGSYSITDSSAGNYSDTSTNCLTSNTIDLRMGGDTIRFWHRYAFATNDRGRLYFSPNGSTWYYYTSPSSTFTGTQSTWTEAIFPLNSIFITSSFQFRFCVEPTNDGSVADGWYIDDVRIYGGGWGRMSEVSLATSGDNTDEKYIMMGGTSMATPLTAGAAALVRQFYTDNQGITPSAALLKATIINGATDMNPGQYGIGSGQEMNARPNNVEGWGRVNIMNSIFPTAPRVLRYDNYTTGLSTGNYRYYQFTVNSSAEPLRATLVWTDYPSTPSASRNLVNDLDMSLQNSAATTYYPNGLSTADTTNNVEGIDIESPAAGAYCLAIYGRSVPNGPQPYALVVSGNISTFTFPSSCGTIPSIPSRPPITGMMLLLLPVAWLLLRRFALKLA
ncbi:MAG: S8 family serine peptidase [Nitrospirae bacterium]|nr:S8 family serine peptidase [Nitrospirota bacterium]